MSRDVSARSPAVMRCRSWIDDSRRLRTLRNQKVKMPTVIAPATPAASMMRQKSHAVIPGISERKKAKTARHATMRSHICCARPKLRLAIANRAGCYHAFVGIERVLRRAARAHRWLSATTFVAHAGAAAARRTAATLAHIVGKTRSRHSDYRRRRGGRRQCGRARRSRIGDGDDSRIVADPR